MKEENDEIRLKYYKKSILYYKNITRCVIMENELEKIDDQIIHLMM